MLFIHTLAPIRMNQPNLKILKEKGWTEIENISSDEDLIKIAKGLGQLTNHPNGQLIGKLKPKDGSNSIKGTFSNQYGYDAFPLHTDTAFWPKPVRYVLLGSKDKSICNSFIVSVSDIWKQMTEDDKKEARQAIYLIKTIHGKFYSSLLFRDSITEGLKYDPSCMQPLNKSAKKFQPKLEKALSEVNPKEIQWTGNKVVVIDNWRTLHGRRAAKADLKRELKRIYIK